MADFIKTQNSFADGEVSPEFFARDNLNGLSRLENMDVLSGGGLRRRRGLASVAELSSDARLIPFSVSESAEYLLALTNGHVLVYQGNTRVADLLSPWNYAALAKLQYAQRFGTMIFVHPDYQPYVLEQTDGAFDLSVFSFERNDSDMSINMPFINI